MPDWLLGALAFALVLEGLVPLLSPRGWRRWVHQVMALTDGQIRFLGLACVLLGAGLLAWSRL